MTEMHTVECYRVYVFRGHWQLRAVCDTVPEVRAELTKLGRNVRVRITPGTRRVASFTQAPAPTAAQKFREQQADKMVIRRQAFTYYKSGSNGTEVLQPPKDGGE